MADLTVLDVGHGNSAVIAGPRSVVVVDAPLGPTLEAHLESQGIDRIAALLISHADADHIGGATNLLVDPGIRVDRVYVNTETTRESRVWKTFLSALAEATTRGAVDIKPELTTTTDLSWCQDFVLEVLSPTPIAALSGAGGIGLHGKTISANEMSAVVRVSGAASSVLLAGDADATSLDEIRSMNPEAAVLVFPHHGGRSGRNDFEFAKEITAAVNPNAVVFSLGRFQQNNPLPDIVRGVKAGAPQAWIACTQLSRRCASALATSDEHLMPIVARGRERAACCAGSMRFQLDEPPPIPTTWIEGHQRFVNDVATTAVCKS